jgi:S-adenosylmethionine:tRNA ribosyltransferase-isomerase
MAVSSDRPISGVPQLTETPSSAEVLNLGEPRLTSKAQFQAKPSASYREPSHGDPQAYESPRPPSGLLTADFEYDLPDRFIAQVPAEPRDSARLFDATGAGDGEQRWSHRQVSDLADVLLPGDALIVNETFVIPARLELRKDTGGAVEVLLLDPMDDPGAWSALIKPAKRLKPGTRLRPGPGMVIEIGSPLDDGTFSVRLLNDENEPITTAMSSGPLQTYGHLPLPPYITAVVEDTSRYQTVFGRIPGSVAAPTAGLHFTPELFDRLRNRGIEIGTVDLAVGIDTFRSVNTEKPEDHPMHSERYSVREETVELIAKTKRNGGRVVSVGTTTTRSLETAAASGRNEGRTKLFIYGDYEFRTVDVMMTNFHMPRTSLLMMIEAFTGQWWRAIYAEAMNRNYRFLSFGDAMLLPRRR